jgi:HAD superfamily hydrolase (TIGR01509 family)
VTAPNPPAAALFDNDGLLLDTEMLWTRAERVLFTRYGLTFTDDHKRTLLGTAQPRQGLLLAEMLGEPAEAGPSLSADLHDLAMDEIGHGVEPMPGALELLARAGEAGLRLGLASNSPRAFVDGTTQAAGIVGRFDVILSGSDVTHPKPAPDLYLALAQRLGVDAASCVAFEDSPTGVAAARAAGAFTVGIPSFPGVTLEAANLVCDSLNDPRVADILGLPAS